MYDRGLSSMGITKSEKCAKTKLRLSLPKTHYLFAVASGTLNTAYNKEGEDPHLW